LAVTTRPLVRAGSRDDTPGKGAEMARECDILVVEDDAEIGMLVRDLLNMEGYRVTVAANYPRRRRPWVRKPSIWCCWTPPVRR
jgi:hypothetical protein